MMVFVKKILLIIDKESKWKYFEIYEFGIEEKLINWKR